ncbi:MAG TPA: alpha/beta fold hydrolase [Jatrophihabitans sp.]|uniref:esterase/lipase family protein n=1 Tax=Jatrophihabitans sp. TaxID=1932789 RepID=UPI002F1007F6
MSVRGWVSRSPALLRRTPVTLANGALAAGQELVWMAAHALTYPVGLLAEQAAMEDSRYRIDTLSPLTRGLILADITASGRPVLLVHGIGDNRSAFTILRRTLRRRGFGRIVTVNYSPLTSDVRKAAADLARHVERVCQQSGYEQVFLVGHSLGGIIARYYVQCLAGDARVSTLVTLGSPHAGSQLARIAPLLVGRQLRPNSELMRELAGPARCSTRFVAIYSDRDEVVVPNRSARLEHPDLLVTALQVHGVGHLSLLVNSTVAHAVAAALTTEAGLAPERAPQPADGSPVPAG